MEAWRTILVDRMTQIVVFCVSKQKDMQKGTLPELSEPVRIWTKNSSINAYMLV